MRNFTLVVAKFITIYEIQTNGRFSAQMVVQKVSIGAREILKNVNKRSQLTCFFFKIEESELRKQNFEQILDEIRPTGPKRFSDETN